MIENVSLAFKGAEEIGFVIGNIKAQDVVEGRVSSSLLM